jgi:ribosomal protein S18 acetylase RimI-like enzyme
MNAVRPAIPDDIPELLRHRELLFTAMGRGTSGPSEWREAAARDFKERLADQTMAAFVVDGPAGLAASGVGSLDRRIPSPENPTGHWGYISGMVTDPACRRQGHARAIMTELLAWFGLRDVRRIQLSATADGEALYRHFGFQEHPATVLTWLRPV